VSQVQFLDTVHTAYENTDQIDSQHQ